jgi:Acetyltransferase (GNAT) domain
MKILRRAVDPAHFDALTAPLLSGAVNPFPYSPEGDHYYAATVGADEADLSFAILDTDRAVIAVIVARTGDKLGRFGQPSGWLNAADLPASMMRNAVGEALGELKQLMKVDAVSGASLLAPSPATSHDSLAGGLLSLGFVPVPSFMGCIDLSLDPAAIERGLRKGHRPQVKWGRSHLALTLVDHRNADIDLLDRYRQLHADVAGRVTRGEESWQATNRLIQSRKGRLVLSSLDGELVGGTLVLDAGQTAYYGSGAYRREHFDKPLGHWPLLAAILASRENGLRRFDLGDVTPRPLDSEKDRNIIRFKRGFSPDVMSGLVWSWTRPMADQKDKTDV